MQVAIELGGIESEEPSSSADATVSCLAEAAVLRAHKPEVPWRSSKRGEPSLLPRSMPELTPALPLFALGTFLCCSFHV